MMVLFRLLSHYLMSSVYIEYRLDGYGTCIRFHLRSRKRS